MQGWNYIPHFGVNIMYPVVNECPVSCVRLLTDSYDTSMCKDTSIVFTIFHDVQDINEYCNLDILLLDAVTPASVFESMTPKVDVENDLLMTLDSSGTDSPGIPQNDRDSTANIFCAPEGAAMAAYASLYLYVRCRDQYEAHGSFHSMKEEAIVDEVWKHVATFAYLTHVNKIKVL